MEIFNRKSSFGLQIIGCFQPKMPAFLNLEAILLLPPASLLGEPFLHPRGCQEIGAVLAGMGRAEPLAPGPERHLHQE